MAPLCCLAVGALSFAPAALAQNEIPAKVTNQNRTGDLPFSTTVGTAIEHVDVATASLNVELPLFSMPGRNGLSAGLQFHWSSNYFLLAMRTDAFGNPYWV